MVFTITPLQSIVKIITLHTFFLSALMSMGMLLSDRKKVKNQIFFGLFLAFSLLIFYFFLYESNLVESHPYLSVLCLPGMFLIGPMIYFLTLYSVNKTFEFSKKQRWHVLPAIISLPLGIIAVYFFGFQHSSIFFDFFGNELILILGFFGSFSFMFYLVSAGKKLIISYLWHFKNIKNEPSALASFILFDIFLAGSVTDSLTLFTGNYIYLQLSELLLSTCVILLFFVNLIYPGFNVTISNVVEREKHKRSYLSHIDTKSLKHKIDELMDSKEEFLDEHLTLEKLASLCNVTTHQLSEFINEFYNKNFTSFVNEYRIEKAKELILKKPEYTFLAVAFEVGFNSKSAFNEAFRKITGQTPSQFKNKCRS